jgi:hypothetical protein
VTLAVTVILTVSIVLYYRRDNAIVTGVGQQQVRLLPDGTRIVLNTDTRIEVDYDERERRVRLIRGEAWFEVSKRPTWPFLVRAGGREIRALGTSFIVRQRKSDPSDRKVVIPRGAKLNITDNKVAEIAKELRRLKVDESPHAIAVLLRVFLELSIDHYMDAHKLPLQYVEKGGNKRDKSLNSKMQEVSTHLVGNEAVVKKDLLGVERAVSDPKSPLHLNLLHAYVHNRFVTPKARELIAAWNEAQRFMECIWA